MTSWPGSAYRTAAFGVSRRHGLSGVVPNPAVLRTDAFLIGKDVEDAGKSKRGASVMTDSIWFDPGNVDVLPSAGSS